MTYHILEADSVQLSFQNTRILSDIYLRLETGKITGLLGRNGEGKSSLMKIIYGSLAAEKSIRIDNVFQPKAYKRPDLLMYLPQFNFIPAKLSLKRIFCDFELDYADFVKRFPEFAVRYISNMDTLSGGERRMAEIYVILQAESKFTMLDEPFTHLNPMQIDKIKEFLLEKKHSKGLLITDHMFRHVQDISDSLYLLAGGKTHLIKTPEDIERLGYARL